MALNVWQLPFEKEKALLKLQIAIKTRDAIKAEYERELERGLNPKSKVTITKCINEQTLFKNIYNCFKIEAPVIYDSKPFELLGTREDIITKTNEEILNVNV